MKTMNGIPLISLVSSISNSIWFCPNPKIQTRIKFDQQGSHNYCVHEIEDINLPCIHSIAKYSFTVY